jgi:hypothetical protein
MRADQRAPAGTAPTVAGVAGTERFVLSDVEFDVAWQELVGEGGRPTPPALGVPSAGRTHAQRRELEAAARRSLAARFPPAAGAGLVRLLALLALPAQQLELRGRELRAVAACGGGAGALAIRRPGSVCLSGCDSAPVGLLGALPAAGPGPGRSCSLPTSALAAALGAPALLPALLARLPAGQARVLARLLDGAEQQVQIVAQRCDSRGELHRAGGVVGILDGSTGRYQLTRSQAADGTEWTTIAPAGPRGLLHRVAELLDPGQPDAERPGMPAAIGAAPATTGRSGPARPLPRPRPRPR